MMIIGVNPPSLQNESISNVPDNNDTLLSYRTRSAGEYLADFTLGRHQATAHRATTAYHVTCSARALFALPLHTSYCNDVRRTPPSRRNERRRNDRNSRRNDRPGGAKQFAIAVSHEQRSSLARRMVARPVGGPSLGPAMATDRRVMSYLFHGFIGKLWRCMGASVQYVDAWAHVSDGVRVC